MSTVYCKPKGVAEVSEFEADIAAGTVIMGGKCLPVREVAPGVPFTGRVYGTLFNHRSALEEAMPVLSGPPYGGAPQEAVFYFKPANTLAGYGDAVIAPAEAAALRIEGNIGVVIGKFAGRLTRENALDHVRGYTLVCDVSLPTDDFYRHPLKQRCRDGFCPAGPWVVPALQLRDPGNLDFRVSIDGEIKQTGDTGGLIRPIPDLLVEITAFMSLYPGDVILAGAPGKAPLAKAGQIVRIESNALGVLENPIVAEGVQ